MTDERALSACPLCKAEPRRNGRGGAGGVLCTGDNVTVGMIHRFQTYGADQAEADAAWNRFALTPAASSDERDGAREGDRLRQALAVAQGFAPSYAADIADDSLFSLAAIRLAMSALAASRPADAGAGEAMQAKYADMDIDERAVAMADNHDGDPWELIGFFREKLRQSEHNAGAAKTAAIDLAVRLRDTKAALATPKPTDAGAGVLEALDEALKQYSEPMSMLNGHELGERLAGDVAEVVRHARARTALATAKPPVDKAAL